MKKKYRVVNMSTYTKRLILGSREETVKAKNSIEVELTQQEFFLARRSPDILVTEVDVTPQKIKNRSFALNRDEHYQGQSGTIAPPSEKKDRPLYEHFMVEVFGLKSRIAQLEAKNAELEAMISACDFDTVLKRLAALENRPPEVVYKELVGALAPSELLNVDSNPQETHRAIFQKIVEQNKELRK